MAKAKERPAQQTNGALPPGYQGAERAAIEKWELGVVLEGVFLAMEQSSNPGYSPILKLREKDTQKVRKFGCPADLQYKLETVPVNAECYIRCDGMEKGKRGKEEWRFTVGYLPI